MLTVAINSFAPFSDKSGVLARLSLNIANHRSGDIESVASAIESKLKGAASVVRSSLRITESNSFMATATCVIGANRKIVPVHDAGAQGFRSVNSAANMFMDGEENIWTLRKTAAGDVMVLSSGFDDIVSINSALAPLSDDSYMSTNGANAILSVSAAGLRAGGGDYIAFVDGHQNLRFGFALASVKDETGADTGRLMVLASDAAEGEEPEDVDALAVVDREDADNIPEPEKTEEETVNEAVSAARGSVSVEDLVSYYKKVYGHSPEFFKQFEQRIRSHQFFQ